MEDKSELLVARDSFGVIRISNTASITPRDIAIKTVGIILADYNSRFSDDNEDDPSFKDLVNKNLRQEFISSLFREILDNDVSLEELKEIVEEF